MQKPKSRFSRDKRQHQTIPKMQTSPQKESGPQVVSQAFHRKILLYWGAALGSFVLLAVVLLVPQPAISPSESNSQSNAEPKSLQASSFKPAIRKRPLSLPQQERPFDTKVEREDLLARLSQALGSSKNKAALHYISALTYSELMQTEKAQFHFQESLRLEPTNNSALADYGKQLIQLGKHEEVIELLTPAVKAGSKEPRLHAELGNAYLQAGEIEPACEVLQKAASLFPTFSTILLRLSQAELQRGDFPAAEKNARLAISLGEKSDATYMALSTALVRLGKREEALEVRKEHGKIPKSDGNEDEKYRASFRQFASHTYAMLASVLAMEGEARSAEKWYLYGMSLDPKSVRNLVGLGDLLRKTGRLRESLTVFGRLVEVEPENPVNCHNLASLAISLQENTIADQALVRLTTLDSSGNSDLTYANFCLQNRNAKRSAKHAKIAATKTQNPEAYALWITALQMDGRIEDALTARKLASAQFPKDLRFNQPLP